MRLRHTAVMAGLIVGLYSGAAQAAYTFTFTETSEGVLQTGSGSLDVTGLLRFLTSPASPQVDPSGPSVTGGGSPSGDIVNGDTYLAIFTSGSSLGTGTNRNADFGTGTTVGFNPNFFSSGTGLIVVPTGYSSGDNLGTSTALYAGQTFDSMGLKQGTQTFRYTDSPFFEELAFSSDKVDLGPVDIDSITVRVGTVPLPGSAPMFGAALLGLAVLGYSAKRKKAAAEA